jgi:hypothetical protein
MSSEIFPTSSNTTYGVRNIGVEDVDVIVESSITTNKESDKGIRQELIPEEVTLKGKLSEHCAMKHHHGIHTAQRTYPCGT